MTGEAYPEEIKPPLPNDNEDETTTRTLELRPKNKEETFQSDSSKQHLHNSSLYDPTTNLMSPRQFTHVFYKNCVLSSQSFGVSKLFKDSCAYYDNVAQKVQITPAPKNKACLSLVRLS